MKKSIGLLVLVFLLASFYGCAGTLPPAEFKKQIADNHRLCADDEVTIKLVAADGVVLDDVARQRMESRIREAVKAGKKNAPCMTSDKRSFLLNSKITRYDKGNAFARAMAAGLGQIHIDGDFSLFLSSEAEDNLIAEFTLQKTFAWGGLYGGVTGIEDIETTFAEAVAETIVAPAPKKAEQASPDRKGAQGTGEWRNAYPVAAPHK